MIKNDGKLYIEKHTFTEWLTIYIFAIPFMLSFVIDFLSVPSFFKYTLDLCWVTVLAIMTFRKTWRIEKRLTPFIIQMVVWLLYTLIVYLFNFQSVFYFLWGFRNLFRFYVGFLAFAMFFREDMAKSALKAMDWMFWVNVAVSLYQFFVMGLKQDYLGGIFGVERGCNGYSTVFFILVVSKSVLSYMEGKEKAWLCLIKSAAVLLVAAIAELKFFFVIFVVILTMAAMLTKFSWRKYGLILITLVILMVANTVLTIIFGQGQTLSVGRIIDLIFSANYASTEDLSRFSAIPTISRTFLTTIPEKLFGMGLGNADTSAFAICNTPFFEAYGDLHYSWFNSAFLFLETGYIGLLLYLAFFVIAFFTAVKIYKNGSGDKLFCQMAIIYSVMCVLLTFYNSTLRRECALIAYFVLALPIISEKAKNNL